MDYQTATSRKLDEEHRDSLALLGRLERGVLGVRAGDLPDAGFAALAKQVARSIAGEVDRHFRFEEEALFARLAAGGEHDLVDLLLEEHKSIRASAADLLPMLLAASTGRLDAAQFAALKPAALEFVERLESHIHKEDAALLPAIDAILDAAVDQEIALAYAAP
jgi:hemerythrin-like domain-containing protein